MVQELLNRGWVPLLLRWLGLAHRPSLQVEALSALTTVAQSTTEHTPLLLKVGAAAFVCLCLPWFRLVLSCLDTAVVGLPCIITAAAPLADSFCYLERQRAVDMVWKEGGLLLRCVFLQGKRTASKLAVYIVSANSRGEKKNKHTHTRPSSSAYTAKHDGGRLRAPPCRAG